MPIASPPDFALLHARKRLARDRSRPTVLWMMGSAVLVVAAVMALLWYLNNFEVEEEERRRGADAQWLEQTVQFHFRRLEDDLEALAQRAVLERNAPTEAPGLGDIARSGGLLWRQSGVVLDHGWVPATAARNSAPGAALWAVHWQQHSANPPVLRTLQDVVRGLRRSGYAGPMRAADGSATDIVWLAVPYFDGGRYSGMYVAAISMQGALQALVPTWFLRNQSVQLVADDVDTPVAPRRYRALMSLPGTDLVVEVVPQGPQASPVPRVFFLVAVLFLLGMLLSLAALRRDFVKRLQVQRQLEAEVSLRTAMESSVTTGLRAWDMEGRVLYVNEAFCAMVGYSARELVGQQAPLPYWPSDQIDEMYLTHSTVISQGTSTQGIEVQFQHRDGHRIDVLIHEAPLTAADGTQLGWMSSVVDISERKRAQQLAAAQQEKLEASGRLVAVGEVASTLAHELNQPLGALSSFANGLLNRLRSGSITPAEIEPVVQRMAALAERAGGVIQRVNAFARKRELELQRVDLAVLVRRVVASAQEQHSAQASLHSPVAPVWVLADALLLEHLVANLCSNAMDWALKGAGRPLVRVALQQGSGSEGAEVLLSVADSGPGVALEDQARIFNAFYSTKDGGMGMGLAICRSIVEAHHGRIEVARDSALGGALFTVHLPLATPPNPTLAP
ncbi:PAS domain S-box protein [Curvibacter sp. APW13]|uniref:two-component system sensor histidine kinase NtrB n=1 Tax=Curvibacter sp. APW13 TaxID=3077236 RepID=UPI0028DEBA9B|nr:PAS domain S-box protein [Curvibacter sp. APW13]MDT8990295.1 PAS domain S-box protein [Curvibacter sp. APW13]